MPKRHPDAPRLTYTLLPPETWEAIRHAWARGETLSALSRRFGVNVSTIAARRDREGWVRESPVIVRPAPGPISALTIAEATLARALDALAQGRAADAAALIKAGDAVGVFADFVAKLRAEADAEGWGCAAQVETDA